MKNKNYKLKISNHLKILTCMLFINLIVIVSSNLATSDMTYFNELMQRNGLVAGSSCPRLLTTYMSQSGFDIRTMTCTIEAISPSSCTSTSTTPILEYQREKMPTTRVKVKADIVVKTKLRNPPYTERGAGVDFVAFLTPECASDGGIVLPKCDGNIPGKDESPCELYNSDGWGAYPSCSCEGTLYAEGNTGAKKIIGPDNRCMCKSSLWYWLPSPCRSNS